jgi:hypothetical protein
LAQRHPLIAKKMRGTVSSVNLGKISVDTPLSRFIIILIQ